jgi:hypothetical protein
MPRTLFYKLHQKHGKLVRARKELNNKWNVRVNDYERILKKGCYVCKIEFNEDLKKLFYPRRLNEQVYCAENTVVLCMTCSQMCRCADPITLLKQLIHIGSRQVRDSDHVNYFDCFKNNTSRLSYDKFSMYLEDQEYKNQKKIPDSFYDKLCSNNCIFCDRKDSETNRNGVMIKMDGANDKLITICSNCESLYRAYEIKDDIADIDGHKSFMLNAIMRYQDKTIQFDFKSNTVRIRNSSLYINHSTRHNKSNIIEYLPGNVRLNNLENGEWLVNFPTKIGSVEPFLEISHEHFNVNGDNKQDIAIVSRANQIIDSLLITPHEIQKKCINDASTISLSCDETIKLIETGRYPGQISNDSHVQVGIPHINTKICIVIEYTYRNCDKNYDEEYDEDCKAMRIRFYSDTKLTTACECKSTMCDKCIVDEITRSNELNLPLGVIYVKTNDSQVHLRSKYIKNIRKHISAENIDAKLDKNYKETEEEYSRRVHSYVRKEKKRIEAKLIGDEEYRKKNNDYMIQWRRSKGVKSRKKESEPQSQYNKSYKENQIEKYGEDVFRKINAMKVKICRLKKKGDSEDKIVELHNEMNRLMNI